MSPILKEEEGKMRSSKSQSKKGLVINLWEKQTSTAVEIQKFKGRRGGLKPCRRSLLHEEPGLRKKNGKHLQRREVHYKRASRR